MSQRTYIQMNVTDEQEHEASSAAPKLKKVKKTQDNRKSNADLKIEDYDQFLERFKIEHRNYEWLLMKEECMFCKDCDTMYEVGSHKYKFGGSTNFQRSTLSTHDGSKYHLEAAKSAKSKQKSVGDMRAWTAALPKDPEDKHLQLFRNMYYLAKNNIALSNYETLNEHLKDSGVPMPPAFYSNKSGRGILHAIGYHLCLGITKDISKSPTFGLMFDEATNVNGTKDLVVYVQYLDQWTPKSRFLALLPMEAFSAADIFQTLHKFLEHFNLLEKLTSITTDGARVMTGENGGVIGKFNSFVNKSIINLHCTAHCMNLITSDFLKEFLILNGIYDNLAKLNTKVAKSSKKLQKLFEIQDQEASAHLKTHKPTKVRWLSLNASLLRFFEIFKPIIQMLREFSKEDDCMQLLTKFTNYTELATMAYLADVTSILSTTCKTFQKNYVLLDNVFKSVDSDIKEITKRYLNEPDPLTKGHYLSELTRTVNQGEQYRGVSIRRTFLDNFTIIRRIKAISKFIISSFSRITDQKDVVKAISYFNIENIKKQNNASITSNEASDLDLIAKHYNYGYSVLVKEEFRKVKQLIINDYKALNPTDVLIKIFEEHSFELCAKIFQVNLTLSTSTAQCERLFSSAQYIKNRWRNSIGPASLNSLLHVKHNTKSKYDLDFKTLYHFWKAGTCEMYYSLLKPTINGKVEPEDLNLEDEDADVSA